MMLHELKNEGLKIGVDISPSQLDQLKLYIDLLVKANESFNLTAIAEKGEVLRKHILDSLFAARFIGNGVQTMVDIGTGAGLPGIPLAVIFPGLRVTLVDSTAKKVRFIEETVQKIGLEAQARAVLGRAEDLGRAAEHRGQYDVAISRAVAKLNVLTEFCLPLVMVGGRFLAMKGPSVNEEIDGAQNALEALGGEIKAVEVWKLPVGNEERSIVVVEKVRATSDDYPRRTGMPAKKPL